MREEKYILRYLLNPRLNVHVMVTASLICDAAGNNCPLNSFIKYLSESRMIVVTPLQFKH